MLGNSIEKWTNSWTGHIEARSSQSCIHRLCEGAHHLYHAEGGGGERRGQGCQSWVERALAFLECLLESRQVCWKGDDLCSSRLLSCRESALFGRRGLGSAISISGLQTSLADTEVTRIKPPRTHAWVVSHQVPMSPGSLPSLLHLSVFWWEEANGMRLPHLVQFPEIPRQRKIRNYSVS